MPAGANAAPDPALPPEGAPPSGTGSDPAREVAIARSFTELLAAVRRGKAQVRLLAAATGDVDSSTLALLASIAVTGPVRASALAASVHSDLSTVSRQVTRLVAEGLLERRADHADGRAWLLALTERGRLAAAEHASARSWFFAQILAEWSPSELDQFGRLLDRFAVAYDQAHAELMRAWATRSLDSTPMPEGAPETAAPGS